jgi:hypothetical protein
MRGKIQLLGFAVTIYFTAELGAAQHDPEPTAYCHAGRMG